MRKKQMGETQTNFLIPKHRKLAEQEIISVLDKYELTSILKLPKIKKGDPGLAELEAQVSDVIEITRNSFAGQSKYYRVVIE
jgi:DNA-directed RNA polymerase subunit H (RpoH/RPB5)